MMTPPPRALRFSVLGIIAAAALGACETIPGIDGGGAPNFAAGHPAGERLGAADREALATAFVAAMDGAGQQNWKGRRASGAVVAANFAIAGLEADPDARVSAARGDFDLNHMMETDLGLHVLTRNSNIRIAPDAKAKIAEVLPSGSGVEVVGGVQGRNWMLIAVENTVRGYVFGDLLIKAPGSELELAGGPVRQPVLCRNFRQRIDMDGRRSEWEGAACRTAGGWRIAHEPVDENAPQELTGF